MKKIIFLSLIIFSFAIFSKGYTNVEKKEILQQYKKFQQALKEKNEKEISKFIEFPLNVFELSGDKSKLSKSEFFKNKEFEYLDMSEIDINKLEMIPINDYLLYSDNDGWGDEYLRIEGRFIDSDTREEYSMLGGKEGFLVYVEFSNDVTVGGKYYFFDLVDKKLKLKFLYFSYS